VSDPEENHEAVNGHEVRSMADDAAQALIGDATSGARQPTGDNAVDDVLAQLDAVTDEPLDSQIQVGEQVHRVLQGRLADLGKE
jgi:hypothetical protein